MLTDREIKIRIIQNLQRRRNWGASHTSFENLKKGYEQQDIGKRGSKRIDKLANELIKDNLILSKPTGYGKEVSLNPEMHDQIDAYTKTAGDAV